MHDCMLVYQRCCFQSCIIWHANQKASFFCRYRVSHKRNINAGDVNYRSYDFYGGKRIDNEIASAYHSNWWENDIILNDDSDFPPTTSSSSFDDNYKSMEYLDSFSENKSLSNFKHSGKPNNVLSFTSKKIGTLKFNPIYKETENL